MSHHLNIVSFDVPFPANYGGVIDVYYKLYWLNKAGVKIHLHCFTYGRKAAKELEALCEEVFYYERQTGLLSNLSMRPYTVVSRQSKELEKNLLANDFPILFEVLHTCYLLTDKRFANRKKIYRHSNIEHEYYNELAKSEKSLIKKVYLKIESIKLKLFESVLSNADLILAVNKKDREYFALKYPKVQSLYLPSFHPNAVVSSKLGKGDYILFHGNLSVSENYEAASWLIKHVFRQIKFPVVIAGLNPPSFLIKESEGYPHIRFRENPNEDEMTQLIRNAQIHVLYTAQPTGLKLKLLNVLFKGRFIICNEYMISGTGLNETNTLILAEKPDTFVDRINACFFREYSEQYNHERLLSISHFDNETNARNLISAVFSKD